MVESASSAKDAPLAPQPKWHVGSSMILQLLLRRLPWVWRSFEWLDLSVFLLLNLHLLRRVLVFSWGQ